MDRARELRSDDTRLRETLFVLVHGTFARKSTWVERDSDFARRLTSKAPNSRTDAFRWSGGNSERSRRRAAKELAQHTANLRSANPDSEIVVIGHSHGGNVALGAYNEQQGQHSIDRIACLGTPFFRFRARELGPAANMIAAGVIAIFCTTMLINRASYLWKSVVAPTIKISHHTTPGQDDPSDFSEDDLARTEMAFLRAGYALIFFAAIPPVAFLLIPPVAWLCKKALLPIQQSWLRRHSPPRANPPMLVFYTQGDEARGWLWFIERIWRPVFTGLFVFGQILTKSLVLAIPIGFVAIARSIAQKGGDDFIPYFGSIGNVVLLTGFTYLATLGALTLSILAAVYGSFVAGAPWGFGSAGLISYQLIAVTAIEWPIEKPNVDAVLVKFEGPRSFGALLHSAFYSSESVTDHICSWLVGGRFCPPNQGPMLEEKVPIMFERRRQWLYAVGMLVASWLLWWILGKVFYKLIL